MDIVEELNVLTKGVVEIIPSGGLEEKLKQVKKEKRPLIVKLGADPSAPDIHLGHTVVLRKLRDFQRCGHKVIFLIGDFTGMIGDPTGKSKTRKPLTEDEVQKNAESYKSQIFKILDPDKTEIVFNSHWISPMKFTDVINLCSKYTVAQMLERDDFQKRYQRGDGISITEFLYSLIQGYDSVHLKADIELGGTDQMFNLLVGRQLQKEFGQAPQIAVMLPLLEGLDGVNKMSKSLDNYIGIDDSPKDMFGKVMSISDEMIIKYFTLLTDLSLDDIDVLDAEMKNGVNPRNIKVRLAKEIIKTYYPEEEAEKAEEEFNRIFAKKGLPDVIPEYELTENPIWIIKLLTDSNLVTSSSEARRLIKGGGLSINDEKLSDQDLRLQAENGMIIKAGKRKFLKLKID